VNAPLIHIREWPSCLSFIRTAGSRGVVRATRNAIDIPVALDIPSHCAHQCPILHLSARYALIPILEHLWTVP
jgi:hypothetical protein